MHGNLIVDLRRGNWKYSKTQTDFLDSNRSGHIRKKRVESDLYNENPNRGGCTDTHKTRDKDKPSGKLTDKHYMIHGAGHLSEE